MPNFFFDIGGDSAGQGVDLPDLALARAYAMGLLESIMSGDAVKPNHAGRDFVTIRDENGQPIDLVLPERLEVPTIGCERDTCPVSEA